MKSLTITRDGQITHGPSSFPSDSELQEHLARHVGMGTYGAEGSYEVLIEDITEKVAQDAVNSASLQYLASTDWFCSRFVETGVEIPEEIRTARAEARAAIK